MNAATRSLHTLGLMSCLRLQSAQSDRSNSDASKNARVRTQLLLRQAFCRLRERSRETFGHSHMRALALLANWHAKRGDSLNGQVIDTSYSATCKLHSVSYHMDRTREAMLLKIIRISHLGLPPFLRRQLCIWHESAIFDFLDESCNANQDGNKVLPTISDGPPPDAPTL